MSNPINIIKGIVKNKQALLIIDQKPLLDLLDEAYQKLANNGHWNEKRDALLHQSELKKSCKRSGEYDIYTCVHCKMHEDIILDRFKVIHQDDLVIWQINPPGANVYFEQFEPIVLQFHHPQYVSAIERLMEQLLLQ